ncbi:DUF6049 family protein [Pedococcus sp. 5OH_020]|uniref:DUF6049 family protein n=1 Tax=Pedococcus sp. 5OH_020 TaxID=2989814 RepID=UPI0022EA0F86|nr:DUF6049 family protein [Pedococcus sp. 5OH_020]
MVPAAVRRVLAAASLVLPLATVAPLAVPAASATTSAGFRTTATTTAVSRRSLAATATVTAGEAAVPAAQAPVVELSSVSPAVLASGQDLVISGLLRNEGTAALVRPTISVVVGRGARDRAAVRAWAAARGPAAGSVVAQLVVPATVRPGSSSPFRIAVKGLADREQSTYGALPLSIESGAASVRTFAGYQRLKQYQPMTVAWAVPVTLDPDPDLFGAAGNAREAAWTRALGPDSRVTRVLDATQATPVTWAVDPTLAPGLLASPVDVGTKSSPENALRTEVQNRIQTEAPAHIPWVLPDTDADLGAVAGLGTGRGLMQTLVGRAGPVAQKLGGRGDLAWPADGAYTASGETTLRQAFRRPSLAGQVASAGALGLGSGTTPSAAQRSTTGLALLAYDDSLSGLLARTTSPSEGVLSTQQFMADSAALLNELPGTSGRTVFVAAPRSFNPDPETARRFLAAAASLPWLTPSSTEDLLASARHAAPTPAAPVTRPSDASPNVAKPVLTRGRIAQLERTVRTVRGVALIRDDGDEFARTWTRAAEQLASVRWRAAPTAWNTLSGRVQAAARQTTTAVKVSAGTVNFLADSGRLQITVTNDLDVPVEDVKLRVEASNPRLRIDSQPPVLRIGPKSRATVNVSVTALAAGLVPLRTTLTTPDGTVVGQGADVLVRVTPTGDWVYWGLGGVAGAILLLGVVRSVRRRPAPAVSEPSTPTRETIG